VLGEGSSARTIQNGVSQLFAKGLLPYFAFTSLLKARSIATVIAGDSPSVAVVDIEAVGEGERFGGLGV